MVILVFYCTVFLIRSFTEDFLKTGTLLSKIYADEVIDLYISSERHFAVWMFGKNLHEISDWFPLIIGIYLIRIKMGIT